MAAPVRETAPGQLPFVLAGAVRDLDRPVPWRLHVALLDRLTVEPERQQGNDRRARHLHLQPMLLPLLCGFLDSLNRAELAQR